MIAQRSCAAGAGEEGDSSSGVVGAQRGLSQDDGRADDGSRKPPRPVVFTAGDKAAGAEIAERRQAETGKLPASVNALARSEPRPIAAVGRDLEKRTPDFGPRAAPQPGDGRAIEGQVLSGRIGIDQTS